MGGADRALWILLCLFCFCGRGGERTEVAPEVKAIPEKSSQEVARFRQGATKTSGFSCPLLPPRIKRASESKCSVTQAVQHEWLAVQVLYGLGAHTNSALYGLQPALEASSESEEPIVERQEQAGQREGCRQRKETTEQEKGRGRSFFKCSVGQLDSKIESSAGRGTSRGSSVVTSTSATTSTSEARWKPCAKQWPESPMCRKNFRRQWRPWPRKPEWK